MSLHPEREVLLDDDVAQIIKNYQATSGNNIKSISLAWCENLTDKVFESLVNLTSLTDLNLAWCSKITAKGLESIAYLPLDKLNLTGTNIKDTELDRMGEIQEENHRLRENFPIFTQMNSFLHSGNDGNRNYNYKDLYKLMGEYI